MSIEELASISFHSKRYCVVVDVVVVVGVVVAVVVVLISEYCSIVTPIPASVFHPQPE